MRKKKVLLNKEQVLQLLKDMKNNSILDNVRVGLAGSFARGKNKKSSDINIVISYLEELDDLKIFEYICNYMTSNSDYKIDILHLESIAKEDEMMDNIVKSIGLPKNEYSAYKNILKEVIWIE
ncbi:nucleotidyltransferase domain-containing protein [Clostridium sp. CX1]|uniref:nucleotidyltransferase domain-containing protein n=1 Tax=Clostridium sp. CX1 TaxID=2978346 RepID=UPI0021C213A9|nr:nucleotidyltransferase domain-containing protein [Clostridium sp. CX1]MCT8974994.1 nucleotidyltransferase domain-containing protein [Clostridium sp. CX1]